MSNRYRSAIGLTAILTVTVLTGCPNDPIGPSGGNGDLVAAYTAYYEKLQACGILSEGRVPDIASNVPPSSFADLYTCYLNCATAQPCSELRLVVCHDGEEIDAQCWTGCEPDPFRCANGEQVPWDYQCDGEQDCLDGSDEESCNDSSTFTCGDGYEIPEYWVCDHEEDCDDGSDEHGCPDPATWRCDSGESIAPAVVCDGFADCSDGSDEAGCAELMCP